jgi:hypothetical protein
MGRAPNAKKMLRCDKGAPPQEALADLATIAGLEIAFIAPKEPCKQGP